MQCTVGSGAKPQKLGIFENFCVKNIVLLTVSYRKKLGEQDVLVAAPVSFWRSNCSPGSHTYDCKKFVPRLRFVMMMMIMMTDVWGRYLVMPSTWKQ